MSKFIISFLAVWSLFGSPLAIAEKTFVYCSEANPAIFNPQLATDGATFNAASKMIYNQLVDFKPGTTEVVPSLAESWKITDGGKTYTFKLRRNVQFHSRPDFKPSRAMNADDVLFSYARMWDKKHPYHSVNGGHFGYFESMGLGSLITAIEKVDDLTVRFRLSRPESPFLADLGMNFAAILSKEYADVLSTRNQKEKIDFEPVGTGPFAFKSYAKNSQIRYEAFDAYFMGRPKIDKMVFSITPEASVRTQKLKTGECHMIAEPAPSDVKTLKADPKFQIVQGPGLNVGYLAINTEKPPLNNKLVRQAIWYALDRQVYIDSIYLGEAEVAENTLPPTIWAYSKPKVNRAHDMEKAKALLKQAGFAKGFDVELWTLPTARPYNPNGKKMGELMQADLAKVGIRAKIQTYEWATYLAKASKGEHQLIQVGWTGDNGDPDNFMNILLSCAAVKGGSNYARWCAKNYDEKVRKAAEESDRKKRQALYRAAQEIFFEEAPWVPLAHSRVSKAMRKSVKGYVYNPLGTENFGDLDLVNE